MSDFLDKVKAGHLIQTRDGRPAKFIGYAPELRCGKPLVVSVDGHLAAYDDNGRLYVSRENLLDLVLVPKLKFKREGWMAMGCHVGVGCRMGSTVFPSKEGCAVAFPNRPIAYVEWEEEAP